MKLPNLNTKILGKNVEYYEKIDSTQLEVWRRIENKNIKNGTLIIANIQTAGIGTHGRVWNTEQKNNIAFSIFIKVNCNISKLEGITIQIAKELVQVFYELYNIKLDIKEPNDIVYKNKKIGGILTQTKLEGENVKYIVLGIGINTNLEEIPKSLQKIASSIKIEFNKKVENEKVIAEFLNKLEKTIIEKELIK